MSIVMAGVPSIMQAMLDEVAPKLKTGAKLLSETIRADAKEGDVGTELGAIAKANPDAIIGSYPFFDEKLGPNTNIVVRSRDPQKLAGRQGGGRGDARRGEGAAGGRGALRLMPKPQADSPPQSGKNLPRLLGPVPPRLARAGLAAARGGAVRRHRRHHPRRAGAGGDRGARTERAADRDRVRRQLPGLQERGRAEGDQGRRAGGDLDARARARAC